MAGNETILTTEEFWNLDFGGTQVELCQSVSVPSVNFISNDFRHETDQKKPTSTKVSGKVSFSDMSVTRLMAEDLSIWEWFVQAVPDEGGGGGNVVKKIVTLTLNKSDGSPCKKWICEGAFISSFTAGGSLEAGGSGQLTEQFSIAFEKLKVE